MSRDIQDCEREVSSEERLAQVDPAVPPVHLYNPGDSSDSTDPDHLADLGPPGRRSHTQLVDGALEDGQIAVAVALRRESRQGKTGRSTPASGESSVRENRVIRNGDASRPDRPPVAQPLRGLARLIEMHGEGLDTHLRH